MKIKSFMALLSSSFLTASLMFSSPVFAKNKTEDFLTTIQSQTASLSKDLRERTTVVHPLLVMSAQNLDNLNHSEQMGRLLGELISSSLSENGWIIQELQLGKDIKVSQEGKQILTSDIRQLQRDYNADYVIVSTYSKEWNKVYVTLKAVRLSDGLVVASRSFATRTDRLH